MKASTIFYCLFSSGFAFLLWPLSAISQDNPSPKKLDNLMKSNNREVKQVLTCSDDGFVLFYLDRNPVAEYLFNKIDAAGNLKMYENIKLHEYPEKLVRAFENSDGGFNILFSTFDANKPKLRLITLDYRGLRVQEKKVDLPKTEAVLNDQEFCISLDRDKLCVLYNTSIPGQQDTILQTLHFINESGKAFRKKIELKRPKNRPLYLHQVKILENGNVLVSGLAKEISNITYCTELIYGLYDAAGNPIWTSADKPEKIRMMQITSLTEKNDGFLIIGVTTDPDYEKLNSIDILLDKATGSVTVKTGIPLKRDGADVFVRDREDNTIVYHYSSGYYDGSDVWLDWRNKDGEYLDGSGMKVFHAKECWVSPVNKQNQYLALLVHSGMGENDAFIMNARQPFKEKSDIIMWFDNNRTGCISGNCQDGKGLYNVAGKAKWEGEFRNGDFVKGKKTYLNGNWEEGTFAKDQFMEGKCFLMMADSTTLKGEYMNGVMVKAFIQYKNGDDYSGEVKDGKPNGQGEYFNYQGIYRYKGNFVDGVLHGKGRRSKFEAYIEGNWVKGELTGKGTALLYDGAFIEGEFVKSKLNGKALMKLKSGVVAEGIMKNDVFSGPLLIKFPDGGKCQAQALGENNMTGTFYTAAGKALSASVVRFKTINAAYRHYKNAAGILIVDPSLKTNEKFIAYKKYLGNVKWLLNQCGDRMEKILANTNFLMKETSNWYKVSGLRFEHSWEDKVKENAAMRKYLMEDIEHIRNGRSVLSASLDEYDLPTEEVNEYIEGVFVLIGQMEEIGRPIDDAGRTQFELADKIWTAEVARGVRVPVEAGAFKNSMSDFTDFDKTFNVIRSNLRSLNDKYYTIKQWLIKMQGLASDETL